MPPFSIASILLLQLFNCLRPTCSSCRTRVILKELQIWQFIYSDCSHFLWTPGICIENLHESRHPLIYYRKRLINDSEVMDSVHLYVDKRSKLQNCRAVLMLYSYDFFGSHDQNFQLLSKTYEGIPPYDSVPFVTLATDTILETRIIDAVLDFKNWFSHHNKDMRALSFWFLEPKDEAGTTLQVNQWVILCKFCFGYRERYFEVNRTRLQEQPALIRQLVNRIHNNIHRHSSYGFAVPDAVEELFLNKPAEIPSMGKEILTSKAVEMYEIVIISIVNEKFSNSTFSLKYSAFMDANEFNKPFEHAVLHNHIEFHFSRNGMSFLPLRSDSLVFFSCSGITDTLSYRIYLKPFQPMVWTFLIFFTIAVGISIQLCTKLSLSNRFNVFILPLRSLLENVDLSGGNIPRNRNFNMVMTIWLLITVVLSNAYKGLVTSDMAAPKPMKGYEKYADLKEVDIMLGYSDREIFDKRTESKPFNSSLLRMPIVHNNGLYLQGTNIQDFIGSVVYEYKVKMNETNLLDWKTKDVEFVTKMKAIFLKLVVQNTCNKFECKTHEDEVSRCDNIAFMDLESSIMNFKIPKWRLGSIVKRPYLMGKEKLLEGSTGWAFLRSNCNPLMTFLEKVRESGIFTWVEERFILLKETKLELKYHLKPRHGVDELRLSSNFVQALFLMYITICSVNLLSFIAEVFAAGFYWEYYDG